MKKYHLVIYALYCLGIGKAGAQYNVLHNFNDTNGANPRFGSLTSSGGVLYGMTQSGGSNKSGVIFSINMNGSGYNNLHNFLDTTGDAPCGSLTLYRNKFYGMTLLGGAYNHGTIFSIDINGSGYKVLNDSIIYEPAGSLIFSGNELYGMSIVGGLGNIFSIDTDGTRAKTLFNFSIPTGGEPLGSLILSNGKLFGMTPNWGGVFTTCGSIFSTDTNGSTFKDLFIFDGITGDGANGDLTLSGSKLYGLTSNGGSTYVNQSSAGYGCVFSIDSNGNGYKDLFNFNDTNGGDPNGSLVLLGNKLYGLTQVGGVYGDGRIFSIDTNGGGFKDLFDFNGANGRWPEGTLTLSGGVFYGMTTLGGIDNDGVIFSFKDTSTGISKIPQVSSSINLYPNPSKGIFTVESVAQISSIEIENVLGQKIYFSKINSEKAEINLSNQSKGIYFTKIIFEDESISVGKLIIK
ncbi:MAG TPA: choice-of-anchor tandem repeat GloVer-containing protein [Bacteroidia bacterium]|jgi:uncharacterized repeat protein (TIGR03803 family)|nr:choice-of-anchor tandem repeat GloVer-containing protein [Bacteroidia bacterium]